MKRCVLAVSVLLMAVLVPAIANAQQRQGFSFGVGGGIGSADLTCADCDSELGDNAERGPVFYVKLGRAANEHVIGGVELNVWGKTFRAPAGFDFTTQLLNLNGTFQIYPSKEAGFYLKGGAGLSRVGVKLKGIGIDQTDRSDWGWGYSGGLGYDIPLGNIAITPAFNVWGGKVSSFEGLPDWSHLVAEFTIGITIP